MGKTWKVAIVGCGDITRKFYIPQMENIPRAKLVAVCDTDAKSASSCAQEFGVPEWYADVDELLAKCDFDILMDAASIAAHHEINLKALKAGKHLYSQKPVGLTVEQVSEQIEAAQKAGVKYAASPIHPLRPDIRFIRELIGSGAIGKLTMVRAHSAHGGPEYFQHRGSDPSWFYQPGAGALYDMGVHGLTMAVAVAGPAKEVSCTAVVSQPQRTVRSGAFDGQKMQTDLLPDNYIITLNWGEGCLGVVEAGYCCIASTQNMLEVCGTKGVLTILGSLRIGEGDGVRMFLDSPELRVRGWVDPIPNEPPRGEFEQCECLEDLINAIENDTTPLLDPAIARHVIEIMCTIPKAVETKTAQSLTTTF